MRLLKERNCATCTAEKQKRWGCEQDAIIPVMFDGELEYRCPRRPLLDDPFYSEALNTYSWAQQGHFPDPGQWPDQSVKFASVMAIIESAMTEADQESSKKTRGK